MEGMDRLALSAVVGLAAGSRVLMNSIQSVCLGFASATGPGLSDHTSLSDM